MIRLLVVIGLGVAIALVADRTPSVLLEASFGVLLLVVFVAEWVYGIAFELALHGRTPGKVLLGLRAVRVDGAPVGIVEVVLRNLLRGVDYLPLWPLIPDVPLLTVPTFGFGVLVAALDPRLRRAGDLVAGTMVVLDGARRLEAAVPIEPPVTAAEIEALPPAVALTPEELRAIEALLRRRGRLGPSRAEEIAALYAESLSERTGVTAPTALRTVTLAYWRATAGAR